MVTCVCWLPAVKTDLFFKQTQLCLLFESMHHHLVVAQAMHRSYMSQAELSPGAKLLRARDWQVAELLCLAAAGATAVVVVVVAGA